MCGRTCTPLHESKVVSQPKMYLAMISNLTDFFDLDVENRHDRNELHWLVLSPTHAKLNMNSSLVVFFRQPFASLQGGGNLL